MSEKRRDKKGRILLNGEEHCNDGRYRFRYTDAFGKRHSLYSWRLTSTDALPSGKRNEPSLREKEEIVRKEIDKGYGSEKTTVMALVEAYLETKVNVRDNTRACYKTVVNILEKEPFSTKLIKDVKVSDAKRFLIELHDKGKRYSTIASIRGVLRPAFQMAFEDELLQKNPFSFELASVVVNDMVTREAISREEERKFLNFIENDPHFSIYYDGMFLLFKTGLRVSEMCGLTLSDLDFKNIRSYETMTKILFVCHGNICRSPMAEFVMKRLVKEAGKEHDFLIESAATSSEELGNPIYPPAKAKLAEHGISGAGKTARRLRREEYANWDLIIGMDSENMRWMLRIFGSDPDDKLHKLMEYTGRARDVADPWYTRDFEATWQDVNAGCAALLQALTTDRS